MKKVLPRITASATSAITVTSDDQLQHLANVSRLEELFFTGFRYLLSPNIHPAAWKTIHEPLANGFVRKYADPLCLLGVGFGANTSYMMIDVDRHSANHPCNDPQAFTRLLKTLDRIGLTTPVIIQSSWSGGIHIYYFFSRDLNTFRVASLVLVSLVNSGFAVKDGQVELFPNAKQFGDRSDHKRHRLPLQLGGGGAILDRAGNPLMCGVNLNCETQLEAFLQMAKASARGNDTDKIERQLDPVYAAFKKNITKYQHTHKKDESERLKEWRKDLETLFSIGWTGFHQTNRLLKEFVTYGIVFLKLSNRKDLFEWVFKTVTNTNGYQQYCRHQHQIEARIWDWIDPTAEKEFYVPCCNHPVRSSDRASWIKEHKTSKSKPISKAEAYARRTIEQVATRLQETVQSIIDTIAVTDLPTRIGDVIQLIQSVGRTLFGKGFSNSTLYQKHYQSIWMKLIATKKASDMVLVTPITPPNMVYQSKISTESAFDRSVFDTTDLPKTNLKPTDGKTSHRVESLCSVNALSRSPLAHEVDPDPDLPPKLKNIPLDLDSDPTNPIEPDGADLTSRSFSDPTNPIASIDTPSNLDSAQIDSDPQLDPQLPTSSDLSTLAINSRPTPIEPDPEPSNPVPAYKKNDRVQLIDIDNREHQSTGVVCAIIGSRAMVKWDVSRKLNTYPIANLKLINPKPPEKLSDAQQTKISAEKSKYLAQLIPYTGCVVTIDAQVHGMVISVRDRDVYVTWSGGSRTYHSIDELRCTYSPCVNNFIHKLINAKLIV